MCFQCVFKSSISKPAHHLTSRYLDKISRSNLMGVSRGDRFRQQHDSYDEVTVILNPCDLNLTLYSPRMG